MIAKVHQLLTQSGNSLGLRGQNRVVPAHGMDEAFKAPKHIKQARPVLAVQQRQGVLIILPQMLLRADLGAQFFQMLFLAFFRRYFIYLLLLHFQQVAPVGQAGLLCRQGLTPG